MKKILSLFSLACALLLSGSARAWDQPQAPQHPAFEGTWVEPAVGGQYYVYNVGAAQFLGTGLDWGTRTVTTVDSVVTVSQSKVAVALNRNYVVPFAVEDSDLEGLLYIRTMNTNKGNHAYVTAEGNASWSDGDAGRAGHWVITPVSEADYTLDVADTDVCLGVDAIGATTSYTWADAAKDSHYQVNWRFVEATDEMAEVVRTYCKVTYQQYLADLKLYDLRKAFYDVLTEADALGIDNAAAGAVYDSEASMEELQAAYEALKAEVDSKAFWGGVATSSEENPFDVTKYVMQNADFSAACENGKMPPGWEITVTGTNIGQMNRTDVNPNDETLRMPNFIECWTPAPATLGNGYIGQWVTGLPQGRYRLTMEAMACNQSGGFDPSTVTGVYLFAGNGRFNLHSEESVKGAELDIQHYEWDFDFNAEKLLLGLLIENTNANWVSADNFHLYAIGQMQEDPDVAALRTALEAALEMAELIGGNSIDDEYMLNANADVVASFEAAINTAETALSSGENAKAALETLNAATAALQKSAATYKTYQQLYADALEMANQLQQLNQWSELQSQLLEWAGGTLLDAFSEGTLTEETLAADKTHTDELVAAFLAQEGNVQPGNDLTVLIKNADFSRGQYGRTDAATFDGDENSIPGWNIASGNVTELSGDFHNIEVYGKAFDFNQTIKNLPAGTYQLTVQGYVRVDNGENDMVLYAGVSSKQFKDISDEYSETPLLADADGNTPGWPYDSQRADGLGYQPNSMQGAGVYFDNINPLTEKPFYLNDVLIGHTGGDLTFGVRSAAQNNALWVLWDNFTLTYVSSEAVQPILEEIDELMVQYEEVMSTSSTTIKTREEADKIVDRVNAKDEITTMADALLLLQDLKDIIDEVKLDQEAYIAIQNVTDSYSFRASDQLTDDRFFELLDEVMNKQSMMEFASREEIQSYHEQLAAAWIAAVMFEVQDGDDVTLLINNPDFETLNANGWDIQTKEEGGRIGDNQGYQANAVYNNEDEGIHVEHFIEAWRNNSQPLRNGTIAQVLGVLPAGSYRLEVDGFATNQAGEPDGGIQGIYLFAQVGENQKQTSFAPEVDWIPQHYTVEFQADGESQVTVGLLVDETNSNWFVADNFRLFYQGQTAPAGVQSVNGVNTAQTAVFNLDGRQTARLQRGINIVRMTDGTIRKVIVR